VRELAISESRNAAPVARASSRTLPQFRPACRSEGRTSKYLWSVRGFLPGRQRLALLLCERTLPGRAVAHSIFRHMTMKMAPFAAYAQAQRTGCEHRERPGPLKLKLCIRFWVKLPYSKGALTWRRSRSQRDSKH